MDFEEKVSLLRGSIQGLKRELFSVYNYDEEELQELLCRFFQKINECIESTNKALEIMEWVKNEGLPKEVEKIFDNWLKDGTFDTIINEKLFKELHDLIDYKTRIEVTGVYPTVTKQNVVYFLTGDGVKV